MAVQITIDTILYMSYKLSPFMIISFFSFYSLFMKDFKGILILCGILVSSFITVVFSNTFYNNDSTSATVTARDDSSSVVDNTISTEKISKEREEIIKKIKDNKDSDVNDHELLSIFQEVVNSRPTFNSEIQKNKCSSIFTLGKTGKISNLPLSVNIFAFLLAYFIICIGYYNLFNSNILLLIIFSLLLIYDIHFNSSNNCSTTEQLAVSTMLGFSFGILWYYIIDSLNNPELQFFNSEGDSDSCKRENTKFSCKVMVKQ